MWSWSRVRGSAAVLLAALMVVSLAPGGSAPSVRAVDGVTPVCADGQFETTVDTRLMGDVTSLCTDPQGDAVYFGLYTANGPYHGDISYFDGPTGEFTYDPGPGYTGTDTFRLQAYDYPGNHQVDLTVTITITGPPVNHSPICIGQTYSGAFGATITGSLADICSDEDGDTLTYELFGMPDEGWLTIDRTTGDYSFVPNAGFSGSTRATVGAGDGEHLTSTSITFSVGANHAPSCPDSQYFYVDFGGSVSGSLACTDADGDALAYELWSSPRNGSIDLDPATGAFTYTPYAGYAGYDGLNVTATDGWSEPVLRGHSFEIAAPPAPECNGGETRLIAPGGTLEIAVTDLCTDPSGLPLEATLDWGPSNGEVSISEGMITYVPAEGHHGTDGFGILVDNGPTVAGTEVSVLVASSPYAAFDTFTVQQDESATIAVLDNDTDPDGDLVASTVRLGDTPAHGTASVVPEDGSVSYTPDAGYVGLDSFGYTVCDATDLCDETSVTLAVNGRPVAADDATTIELGAGAVDVNVLANDTDPDGDPLTVTGASLASGEGTVELGGPGMVRFIPAVSFTGEAVIDYAVSDDRGGTAGAQWLVTVAADSTPPAAPAAPMVTTSAASRVNESAPLVITWDAVSDAGSGIASYTLQASVGGGAWGTVYTGPDRTVTRLLPFGRSLAFRVMATDGDGNVSAPSGVTTRVLAAYQSSGVTFYRTWRSVSTTAAVGTGYRYATGSGASASLRFNGREVLYVAPRTSAGGYVKVYVDGRYAGRYSVRASTTSHGKVIFRRVFDAYGTHTIKVVNESGGRRANLDAFVVLR